MKKFFLIISILPLCLCLYYLITVVFPAISLGCQTDGVLNLGKPIDNDYNNRLCSGGLEDLVQIDDQLYYNYARDYCWNNGTYKLTENGRKRIKWYGVRFLADQIELDPIRKFQNQLLLFTGSDKAKCYKPESNEFTHSNIPYEALNFQAVNNDIYFTGHPVGNFNLYVFKDGKQNVLLDKTVSDFYCYENIIYYVTSNSELWAYDIVNKADTFCFNLSGRIFNFLIEDGSIYTVRDQSVVKIDLKKQKDKEKGEQIFFGENVESINAWNKKVYICTKTGLLQYDTGTQTTTKLSEYSSTSCYIVDDYWVYFVSEKSSLWRVPQAGGEVEKVFG